MKRVFLMIGAVLLVSLLLFTGCSGGASMKNPGSLYGVSYVYRHGSAYGEDFYIELVPDKVRYASWFDEDYNEYEAKDAPLSEEDWKRVEALVMQLYPQMEPINEKGFRAWLRSKLYREVVMDAGKEEISFMWETEDGPETVKYNVSGGEKMQELLSLLDEIARACPAAEE